MTGIDGGSGETPQGNLAKVVKITDAPSADIDRTQLHRWNEESPQEKKQHAKKIEHLREQLKAIGSSKPVIKAKEAAQEIADYYELGRDKEGGRRLSTFESMKQFAKRNPNHAIHISPFINKTLTQAEGGIDIASYYPDSNGDDKERSAIYTEEGVEGTIRQKDLVLTGTQRALDIFGTSDNPVFFHSPSPHNKDFDLRNPQDVFDLDTLRQELRDAGAEVIPPPTLKRSK